jgi:hypothetical protein
LLQADWLLSANREDVLQGNEWNKYLVDASIDLFLSSVDVFNETGVLQFSWPAYAQSQGNAQGSALGRFFSSLKSKLRKRAVLVSQADTLECPSDLQSMPALFMGHDKRALVAFSGSHKLYTSPQYNNALLITTIGVQELTCMGFCKLVMDYVSKNDAEFKRQPAAWQSRLAAAIVKSGEQAIGQLRHVDLIPLENDGQWVNGNFGSLFFAETSEAIVVPQGIHMPIIERNAGQDRSRQALYRAYGAQNLNIGKVYENVVEQHKHDAKSLRAWTAEDIIGHARFLFNAPHKPTHCDTSGVLLVTEGRFALKPGKDLYMNSTPGPRVSDILEGCPSADFIDKRYIREAPAQFRSDFYKWLRTELNVNTLPRLHGIKRGTLSPEFLWLIANKPSNVWLALLVDHWDVYSAVIERDDQIRAVLSETDVHCKEGRQAPLKSAYTSTAVKDEPFAAKAVPVLAVEEPAHAKWRHLGKLGLGIVADTQCYLAVLKYLSNIAPTAFKVEDVQRIYKLLEGKSISEAGLIKYVPSFAVLSHR